jgi:hypothetical protein
LLELRQCRGRCDDAAAEPEGDAQTEAAAISNHHEIFDLIDEPSAAFAIAVKGMMDLFDITTNQRELRFNRIVWKRALAAHRRLPTILIP